MAMSICFLIDSVIILTEQCHALSVSFSGASPKCDVTLIHAHGAIFDLGLSIQRDHTIGKYLISVLSPSSIGLFVFVTTE